MKQTAFLAMILLGTALLGCSSGTTPTPAPTSNAPNIPTLISPGGYRPVQQGDFIEGVTIDYQYVLPSLEQPVFNIAFGRGLIQLYIVKAHMDQGLVDYIRELTSKPQTILAFDENDPAQSAPRPLEIAANKPLEFVVIPISEGGHYWSVTEKESGEIRSAYKLVRRKDGGLRFIDAYDDVTLHSMSFATINGDGGGLVVSSRLALLRLILSDQGYQQGVDVFAARPPQPQQYDPRILKLDPTKTGLAQDVDWVLVSRPGPAGGIPLPPQ